MEDRLRECLSELYSVLQGDLIVGDHESLSVFGSTEQQELGEISKEITNLFLKQGYDIEITINAVLTELEKFDISDPPKKQNLFLGEKATPKIVLEGQYNAALGYIERLKTELTLQEAQILKESALLENLRERLTRNADKLQACLEEGKSATDSAESRIDTSQGDLEDISSWKERLQRKICDLRVSHTIAMQTLAQVQMLIENNQHLAERIKAIVTKAIPLWTEQMDAMIRVVRYSKSNSMNRDLQEELKILAKMENMDQKIRQVLSNVAK